MSSALRAADSVACLQVCHNLFQPNLGLHVEVPVDVAEAEGELATSAQLRNAFACSGALQELLQVASRTVTAAAPGEHPGAAERLVHSIPTLLQPWLESTLWQVRGWKGSCECPCLRKRCPGSSPHCWRDLSVDARPAPLVTAPATPHIRALQCNMAMHGSAGPNLCCCDNDSLCLTAR